MTFIKGYKQTEESKRKIKEARSRQAPPNKREAGMICKKPEYVKGYYKKIMEAKAGRKRPDNCEICGRMGRICFDHDHKTGKFRGWLCIKCNFVLGLVEDKPEILLEITKYINKNVN